MSITHQDNCNRKTHRITIPISAIINQYQYPVLDWSMHGLKLEVTSQHPPLEKQVGDKIDIKLILNTGQSSILLEVEVKIKSHVDNKYGLEITKIDDKNKRVLRHYATLAIDGNIDHVDDLSGNLFMQNVQSPISEPISMHEKEYKKVRSSFLKRFYLYTLFSIILFVFILATFLYNYIIVKSTQGLISGNSMIYSSPYDGYLKNIYIKKGERVSKDQILFEMDTKEQSELLDVLKNKQKLLEKQILHSKDTLRKYQQNSSKSINDLEKLNQNNKVQLNAMYKTQNDTYTKATNLYNKKLITYAEYTLIQAQYMAFMDQYQGLTSYNNNNSKNKLLTEQILTKNETLSLTAESNLIKLAQTLQESDFEIKSLQQQIDKAITTAKQSGLVYHITHQVGEYLEYAQNILILQTDTKPYILSKILIEDVSSLHIAQKCIIYSSKDDKIYFGHISGIGYPATDGINVGGHEMSQNEIPIRIEFEDDDIRFNLNEYLDVYILNSSSTSQEIIKFLTKKFH